jgi:Holliday junction resolvasome RuvABC ATP-dependent DNA helicase subunit
MAISYMAGILNRKDAGQDEVSGNEDVGFFYDNAAVEDEDTSENDTNYENEPLMLDDDYENVWKGNDYKLPIVQISDIRDYEAKKNGGVDFNSGAFLFNGQKEELTPPYWVDLNVSNVCIEAGGYAEFYKQDVEGFEEFMGCDHIYLLQYEDCPAWIDENRRVDDFGIDDHYIEKMMSEFENEILLEYSSDTVEVKLEREEYMEYYRLLTENWLAVHELRTEKNFPMDEFVKQVIRMNKEDKSYLIDRLLTVIKDKKDLNGVLKREDLKTFDMFKFIAQKDKKDDKSARSRLENELVGMDSVKEQIRHILNMMKMNKLRESKGLSANSFHYVFLLLGAPGTAKTTVANIMGKLMKEEKLLPGDRFISVNGTELKGMYVGHSAPKTKQIFDQHDIILIDEAYSLAAADCGGMDIFAQEALSQLMIELEKHSRDKLIMFAGYGGENVSKSDNKMIEFLKANPGLRSRINSTIVFPSYREDEMVKIVHKQAELMDYVLDSSADNIIKKYFAERRKDETFGNGREARRLIETCQYFMAERIFADYKGRCTKTQLKTIKFDDVRSAIEKLKCDERAQAGVKEVFGFSL